MECFTGKDDLNYMILLSNVSSGVLPDLCLLKEGWAIFWGMKFFLSFRVSISFYWAIACARIWSHNLIIINHKQYFT